MALDPNNRIKYDHVRGEWRVLFQGTQQATPFKTSGDAYAHLEKLLHPPKAP
jgi:hypothetical protein